MKYIFNCTQTHKPLLLWLTLLCLSFLSAPLLADEHDREELLDDVPDERWYEVEVLIYEQKHDNATINEKWLENIALNYPLNWVRLKTLEEYKLDKIKQQQELEELKREIQRDNNNHSNSYNNNDYSSNPTLHNEDNKSAEVIPEIPLEIPFIKLDENDRELNHLIDQLRWAKQRVFFHEKWRQPFIKDDHSDVKSILVSGGNIIGEHHELEGSITIELSRYLHLHTNLWLARFSPNTGQESPWPEIPTPPDKIEVSADTSFADNNDSLFGNKSNKSWFSISSNDDDLSSVLEKPYVTEQVITFKQSRRMRSKELHYLDHPNIGLLVIFTPYEPPIPETDEELTSSPPTSL